MTLSKTGVRALLLLLFVGAIWVRWSGLNERLYPYYTGASATHYRHAQLIKDTGGLPPLDRKTSWPDGYSPGRVGANGVEYATGYLFRAVSLVTDLSLKEFTGLLVIFVFSLSVFALYGLAHSLWRSRAAGLLAGFFVAFSSPLVAASDGREYLHAPFSITLILFQLWALTAYWRKRSPWMLGLSVIVAFVLLASWDTAAFYLVFVVLVIAAAAPDRKRSRHAIAGQLLAVLFAGILLPHLRADHFLLAWPVLLLTSASVYTIVGRSLLSRSSSLVRVPAAAWVIGITVVMVIVTRPFAAGGVGMISPVEYWGYRLRFLFAKPDDPFLLSDAARFVWQYNHAPPRALDMLAFFVPFAFLIRPVISSLREFRAQHKLAIWPFLALLVAGVILYLLDRSTIFALALLWFPLVAVCGFGIRKRLRTMLVPLGATVALMLAQTIMPMARANPTMLLASAFRLSTEPTDSFLWVSVGNADRELVRHLATRTSVRDPMLAPPRMSSFMASFAGRTTVLVPGVLTTTEMNRTLNEMRKYYEEEDELYAVCDAEGIQYVLYSIDLLLDTSKYSMRYEVGLHRVAENSLVYKMHFSPQTLTHFNLVYQNDNYRLFRVTPQMEPLFLTDHPPVYQPSILASSGGDLNRFYDTVIDAMLALQQAFDAQTNGDDEEAVRRFRYCLERAPRYTRAWLGVGDSLFRLGDIEAANAAYGRALENSPENPQALYNAALTLARLGKTDEAKGLLDVLISTSRDRALVEQATELKAVIERGIPLDGS